MDERIGKFELLAPLGEGGMGVVYRARDTRLDREVALKLIRPDRTVDEHARQRFLKECRVAAALNHPNIATLYEADESEDGRLYFAAELVEGETLASLLQRGALTVAVAGDFARQLAGALASAHAAGIVHRDIKPGNLMVTADDKLKVLDFGLARLDRAEPVSDDDRTRSMVATAVGTVLGTPGYMAPEQITGGSAGAPADVFSAGVVIHEMLTGKQPFVGRSVDETLRRVIAADPDPPSASGRSVPAGLEHVVKRCLAKEAGDRYCNGAELLAALDTAETETLRRRPWRMIGVAGLVLLVALVASLWWSQQPVLAFETSDRLLIGDVENLTDEPVFDNALRTALEVDLQQSRHALIPGRQELAETLRLSRRPPDTRLDRDTALDLARFAGAKAVLIPTISAVGETLRLEAVLYATETGRTVDRFVVTADGKEAVLAGAVDQLTRQIRSGLGESMALIESSDRTIPEVTTESWEALEALTLGLQELGRLRIDEAIALFEQALDEDPEFVAARAQLGLLLIEYRREPERGRQLLADAAATTEGLSRYERVMLDALKLQFVDGDLDGALEGFAVATDLFPERGEPWSNRGQILRSMGRYVEATVEFTEAVRLDKNATMAASSLWFLQVGPLRDPAASLEVADQMVALFPDSAGFVHMRAWSLVCLERYQEARDLVAANLEANPGHERSRINLAHLEGRVGNWTASAAAHGELVKRFEREERDGAELHRLWQALALAHTGREEESRALIEGIISNRMEEIGGPPKKALTRIYLAQLYAAAELDDESRRFIEMVSEDQAREFPFQRAAAAAMLGDPETALQYLGLVVNASPWDPYYYLILPEFSSLWHDPRFYDRINAPLE